MIVECQAGFCDLVRVLSGPQGHCRTYEALSPSDGNRKAYPECLFFHVAVWALETESKPCGFLRPGENVWARPFGRLCKCINESPLACELRRIQRRKPSIGSPC